MDDVRDGKLPFPGPGIEAVVFDLDGVVTDTAHIHEAAWKSVFDEFLARDAERGGAPFAEFTEAEYGRYVDGKPRYEGAESFLRSRGVDLPMGDPSDPPGDTTVASLGNRKNERFLTLLAEQGVEPYPESVRAIRALKAAGVQVGLITSSRNGRAVLKAANATALFNAIIDGVDAEWAGLSGKPSPDVFLAATLLLGTTPERTAIVEDSQAGCEAGRAGGFGFILGVDRLGMAAELMEAGAHAVVRDLGQLLITTRAHPQAVADAGARQVRAEQSASVAEQAAYGFSSPVLLGLRGPKRLLSDLPSALAQCAQIAETLRSGSPVAFLDYDGTLSPIVNDPAAAVMPGEVRRAVEHLAAVVPVAIVSGRDLRDVRERANVGGVFVAGSHGFEIVGPANDPIETGHSREFAAYLPVLDAAEVALRQRLETAAGVIVERKRFAIAIHFRMADPAAIPDIEAVVEMARRQSPTLRTSRGKKVFELRPDVEWDKGAALEVLLGVPEIATPDAVPLYIGDDLTDEDGFRAVHARNGIAIAVRGEEDRLTLADYGLDDVSQVGRFIGFVASAVESARPESR